MPNTQSKQAKPKQKRATNNNKTKTAPIAITTITRTNAPKIRQTPKGFVVSHREYLQDISSSDSNFRNTTISVNPGLSPSFPWLSAIASRFESYLFKRLHYVYEPICPTTTPGSVMMAVDYDAADSPPATKTALMSYRSAVRSSPWSKVRFDALKSDLRKFGVQRYVRATANPATTDIKTYDVGNLQIATQNTPAAPTTLGELYVEYDIEFFTPQIPPTPSVARRNAEQSAVLAIPSSGPVSLNATITGDTNGPLFWIDKADSTGVDLIMDMTKFADAYLTAMTGTAGNITGGASKLLQFYNNINPDSADPRSLFRFSRVGDPPTASTSSGRYYDTSPTNFVVSHLLAQKGEYNNNTFGADLLPIRVPRPSTGTLGLNLNVQPAHQLPQALFTRFFGTTGTDWAFPNVAIPTFASSRSLKRDTDGVTQSFNYLSPNDVQEITPEQKGRFRFA